MSDPQPEPYGPEGDPRHERSLADLEAALRALPEAPRDAGRLALLVRRLADGTRERPKRACVCPLDLFVDLDLSAPSLPDGTRLRVGRALVEVTPEPHDGCRKFRSRFGADALRFVLARPTRHESRRGIYWKVVEVGEVALGGPVQVLSRP